MSRALSASALTYEYPDGTTAVSDVALTVDSGERVALVGPNGAGKSTLLSLLGGLVDPTAGRVRYFEDYRDADTLRDRIGVVTQDPSEYLFNPTVRAELYYGPQQLDIPESEADARVERLVERLNLDGLLEQSPGRLSGGERRRVALASALAVEPELLLLDEPVADVDAQNRHRILSLLDEQVANGATLIVSTPNVDLVPRVADRVVLLDKSGAVAADGPTASILTDESALSRCGLSRPRLTELFARAGVEDLPVSMDAAVEALSKLKEQ